MILNGLCSQSFLQQIQAPETEDSDDDAPKEMEIISFWNPNITISIVNDYLPQEIMAFPKELSNHIHKHK